MNKKNSVLFGMIVVFHIALSSCDRLGDGGAGRLHIAFTKGGELLTKTFQNLPDTAEFWLKVTDSSGGVVYDGKYGDCPEILDVASGSYNVSVMSSDFTKPAFDEPLFGDVQCVVVPDGGVGKVELLCSQMNAGVRLEISPDFLDSCSDASLILKGDGGKLMYSYSEKRTAYFLPGMISLVMSRGGGDEILMVRELKASEMLTLKVSVTSSAQSASCAMSVKIDTSRLWTNDVCVIGNSDDGIDVDDALSISEARTSSGREDVWVCGYIVGGDLTSTSASFKQPFKSRTNILLGPRSSTSDRSVCVSVQLPDNEVREKLNLVDNPSMLGKRVCIKGDIVSAYFGIPGVKNASDCQIK